MAAMSSAIERAQSLSPKISWMSSTTGALPLTSGYTTKASTVRLSYFTFTHSWWRGDLSSLDLAQSWAEAAVAMTANAAQTAESRTARQNIQRAEKRSCFFMPEVYYMKRKDGEKKKRQRWPAEVR